MAKKIKKTLTLITITLIRLIGPLVFYISTPLVSYLFNGLLDALDGPIYKHKLHLKPTTAQLFDKYLDLWFYTCALAFWFLTSRPYFTILLVFYLYRLIGQITFFIQKNRRIFFYFPNFFEFTFIFLSLLDLHLFTLPQSQVYLAIFILAIIKLIHEKTLHHYQITIFDSLIIPSYRLLHR